jgi:hypothetical protein
MTWLSPDGKYGNGETHQFQDVELDSADVQIQQPCVDH